MEKLIIRHKDFILRAHASENNTTIFDSHLVKSPRDMKSIITQLRSEVGKEFAINKRGTFSMIYEWRTHNLLYSLGIYKDRTRDVDLNIGQPLYAKVLYFIFSLFYLHFK